MKGQLDPQDMIDQMVSVIGADDGKYRNVGPPVTEELIKQVEQSAWALPVQTEPPASADT